MRLLPRSLHRGPRRLVGLLLIPLLITVAGCSAGVPASPSQAPGPVTGAAVAPNGVGSSGSGSATSGGGVTTSNSSIAYPYPIYPGSPGLAPDHTIVVIGIGRADLEADLSDHASAQRSALVAALADAKAQADAVAQAVGVNIIGVLSVSVSSGESYAVPMAAGAAGSAPGAPEGGTTTVPPAPMPVDPAMPQLTISVTVAYRIG